MDFQDDVVYIGKGQKVGGKIHKIFDFWIEGSILICSFIAIYSGENIYIKIELNPDI